MQKSMPRGHNTESHSLGIEYPEDTDFAALLDGFDAIGPPYDLSWDSRWEYLLQIYSPMKTWLSLDQEAAWDYFKNLGETNLDLSLRTFAEHSDEIHSSNQPNWSRVAERMSQMTSNEQVEFFSRPNGIGDMAVLTDLPGTFGDPSEKQRYLTNYLQATVERNGPEVYGVLNYLPPQEREAIVAGLRDIDEAGMTRIREIVSQMEKPAQESNPGSFKYESFIQAE